MKLENQSKRVLKTNYKKIIPNKILRKEQFANIKFLYLNHDPIKEK